MRRLPVILFAIAAACSSPIAETATSCSVHADLRVHCRCPDVYYTVTDSAPWPCGHPNVGYCEPTDDCEKPRVCYGDDGSRVVVGDAELTVTSADGTCTDEHAIDRRQ